MKSRINKLIPIAAILAALLWSARAEALLFEVDADSSSVSITDAGGGFFCFLSNCGIEAELAPGLDGATFDLQTGQTASFDFIRFTGSGTTGPGLGPRLFSVSATLAFLTPVDATTSGSGGGFAYLLNGLIVGGVLVWNDVPQDVSLSDGSLVTVDFQGGGGVFLSPSVTTSASVQGVQIVPEPGSLALLGSALLAFGVGIRWRRNAVTDERG